ncbi:MAG: hypothetical protein QHG99_05140 [Methanomicrobiales archaeon]|nr:hypothetical protein [Methanomicrobiales archaeon]
MEIVIGVPINKKSGYILKEFLLNQEEIKKTSKFPTIIIFSTEDMDFCEILENHLVQTSLNYLILPFKIEKPEWARDRIWGLTQAREEIRKYCLNHNSPILIFMDSDMIFDPQIVNKLVDKSHEGYDVVYNCYLLKSGRITFNGFGGTLIKIKILKDVPFRCYETIKGSVVDEGFLFEMDLLKMNTKIFSGILCESAHYISADFYLKMVPRSLSGLEKIKSLQIIRKFISHFSGNPRIMILLAKMGYYLGKYVW